MDIMNCFICVFMSFGFFMMLAGMIARGDSNYIVNTVTAVITASDIILMYYFFSMCYESHELRYLISLTLIEFILFLTIVYWLREAKTGKKVKESLSKYKIF
mgnify:FL=1